MALTQPILNSVAPFDATQAHTFTFTSSGSSAPITANTLTIRNNTTDAIVYQQTQTTYAYRHVLSAGTLSNGGNYTATIVTHDAQGNSSPNSIAVQFYCFATPSFEITNIPATGIINNSSFEFSVTYNQAQGELLNAYVFNLYNSSGAIVSTSGTKYTTENDLPISASWLFGGFDDKSSYSVEVVAQTAHGMQVSTERYDFSVSYGEAQVFSALNLTNNCLGGYVVIESNVKPVEGKMDSGSAIYIDNKKIDLRNNGVSYDSGFEINGDFTIKMWANDIVADSEIVRLENLNGAQISLYYRTSETNAWLSLRVVENGRTYGYVTDSAEIALPSSAEQVYIILRRINNVYHINLINKGVSA